MARNTYEAWIPEEFGSDVLQRVAQVSAIESVARRVPMKSDTKHVPRSAGVDVEVIDKGAAYGEDTSTNDDVVLFAKKFGKAIRIAEEDIDDTPEDIIGVKQMDWATSYAIGLDNATLATTAAAGAGVPFTSVYKAVRTTDAAVSYTADANYLTLSNAAIAGTASGSKALPYQKGSAVLGLLENGLYWDDSSTFIIAHPAFKAIFRNTVNDQGLPLWVQGLAGTPDTLFGYSVKWSQGARTSNLYTPKPTGNPLLIVGNRNYLQLGIRSGPESILIDGRSGLSALTDETILKMRSRRGFVVGIPQAFAVLELVA